MFDILEY